jgi:hypothetical protein
MPVLAYLPLAAVTAFFSLAAFRLAARKGRSTKSWVMLTLLFGPLTLIPLILLARRRAQ